MRKKKNLLCFIGELGSGGAERVLMEILKHLDREKYTLTVVVNRAGGYFYDKLPDDVTLIDRSLIRKSKYDLFDRIYGLPKIIKQQKADLVVAIMYGAGRSLLRTRLFTDKDVKMMVRIGNNPSAKLRENQSFIWRLIEELEIKYLYPKADSILAISKGIKDDFANHYPVDPDRIRVIHNPINVNEINLLKEKPVDLPDPIDDHRKVIVAIGRLVPQKGYDQMLDAFQRIRREVPSKLLILGDGADRSHIQNKIAEYGLDNDVTLTGFVENPWSYLNRADLYLSTSRYEGFHLTIVEAMACGVVPVATNCDYGPREIITDGVDGRLVPVDNTKAIADAVIELLQNTEKRKKMALEALKRAQDFDISIVVREYEALIDELIEV